MEKIATAGRIHPLFAAAAISVIALSATGVAALTGVLPSSKAEPAPQTIPMSLATQQGTGIPQAFAGQPLAAAQLTAQQPAPQVLQPASIPAPAAQAVPERVVVREVVYREPAPRKPVREAPARSYAAQHQQPAPVVQESKPNYVAIGTGAVVGGLLGNQIGDGNGKKLATLAGIIGGGYAGNELANRNK